MVLNYRSRKRNDYHADLEKIFIMSSIQNVYCHKSRLMLLMRNVANNRSLLILLVLLHVIKIQQLTLIKNPIKRNMVLIKTETY